MSGGSAFPLDKVELLSGPVLSDIEQGCVEPPAFPVTACPSGASYCNPDTPWQNAPKYVYGPQTQIATWSGNLHCAWDPQQLTTPAENQAWKAMSIVDGSRGTFSYPKTTISGWLCESVYQGQQCNGTSQYCMNNSSSQGQIFYTQVNAAGPPPNFSVYPVQTCDTAEGVSGDPATVPGLGGESGFTAIENDMVWSQTTNLNGCKKIGQR